MTCEASKFVIDKGSDNTFTFTIKQDNSTLPLEIVAGDTFFATLMKLGTNEVFADIDNTSLTVEDAVNGKVSLYIPESLTANLITDRGDKVDRYYIRPTYKLILECSTQNNGNFIAKVPEVYVD